MDLAAAMRHDKGGGLLLFFPRVGLLLLAIVGVPAVAFAQTISFTFDDGLDAGQVENAAVLNGQILAALRAHAVKAMLFPIGRRVDSPQSLSLVAEWSAAGHAVGNHTYTHRNLGTAPVTAQEFTADVQRADRLLLHLPTWTKRLRFPYLKEGETAEKREQVRRWMDVEGYRPAYVSIDTSDWYYSQRFVAWRQRGETDVAAFREAYLDHLWDRALYYDQLAMEVLGRRPAHVILLHTNPINAMFLGDVLAMFRDRGWAIVSPEEAFRDAIYSARPNTTPAGESIIWALAKEAGKPGLRYPAEDGTYEEPLLDRKGF
jgi:peptidoglycan/xylan/chitin deacetylase (PgdA/CDA1 family)